MIRLFSRYIPTRDVLFFIEEGFIISLGVLLAIGLRFSFDSESIISFSIAKILFIILICQLTLLYNELYSLSLGIRSRIHLIIKLLQSLGATSVLLAISYFFFPSLLIGRWVFVLTMIILLPLLFYWRIFYAEILFFKKNKEKILIIGTDELAIEIGRRIVEKGHTGYEVVGYLDEDASRVGETLFNPKIIGTTSEILPVVERAGIDRIIVALPDMRGRLPIGPLLKLRLDGIEVEDGVSFYEKISGKIHVSHLKPGWLIFSEGFKRRKIKIGKRIIDIVLSIIGLILAGPIMFLTAALIKADSKGPVLFKQERVGEGGKVFTLLKFRSMKNDAESGSGPVWAELNDHRVTRVGHIIRKLRIDEFPQMINVLKGEMSFVGPRPERPYFVSKLKKKIPYYSLRHTVKPGITGWAQIRYSYGASVKDAMEKLQYDIYYIKNMTLLFDLTIVLETMKTVLIGRGAR